MLRREGKRSAAHTSHVHLYPSPDTSAGKISLNEINNSRIGDMIRALDPECDLPLFSVYF